MSLVGFKAQNHRQQVGKRGPNPKVDDRATAPEVFGPLHERFGFTVDVAALPHNAKLPRYFGPPGITSAAWRCMWDHPDECGAGGCSGCEHRRPAPLGLDGLAQSWAGERVWCNPPYSSIEPWVEKAREEVNRPGTPAELVVMLLPANRTEQGWWQRHIEPERRSHTLDVEFLPGRMRFIAHDAEAIKPNERPPFGVCLVIWDNTGYAEVAA
jgi:hypothetical protein